MYLLARALALVAIAVFGGMALLHAVVLFASDGTNGRWGWLVAGVCVSVGAGWLYRHAGMVEAQAVRDQTDDAVGRGRLVASGRLFAPLLALLVIGGMLVTGVFLVIQKQQWGHAVLIGAVAVLLIVAAFDLLRQALRPGPMLTLDAAGIEHGAYGRIPWSDVVSIWHQRTRVRASTIHVLQVKVRDPVRYLDGAPLFFRWGKRDWRKSPPATGELQIALNVLDRPPETIAAVAQALHGRSGAAATMPSMPVPHPSLTDSPEPFLPTTPEELQAHRRAILARLPPRIRDAKIHVPNRIPSGERWSSIAFSVLLLLYGSWSIGRDDLYVPGRRGNGVHLHGEPAWLLFAAMVCASVVMLSVVADHYDQRDNERHYRTFATVFRWLGWALAALSMLSLLFRGNG